MGIQDPFPDALERVKIHINWEGLDLEGDYGKPFAEIDIEKVIRNILADMPGIMPLINYDKEVFKCHYCNKQFSKEDLRFV